MADKLTPQQKEAVTNRNGCLLVSAAAGSGKTKVLVDRLMSYINDPVDPANLDDFLIITYTKAAAAELRGKISAKLTDLISESPENKHLQRQMQRLYLAKISTIHSFCSDLLREFAYRTDLSADFRMADDVEATQLQIQAMERVLEAAYNSNDSDFYAFIDSQGLGRNDNQVPQIVLDVYEKSRCHLNPEQWMELCVSAAEADCVTDAGETIWGKYLIGRLKAYLDLQMKAIDHCIRAASQVDYMDKPVKLLLDTRDQLQHLRNSETWDDVIARMHIDYGTLTFDKKCDATELISQIKAVRNNCKTGLAKKLKPFSNKSEQVLPDIETTAAAARGLVDLVGSFSKTYSQLKQSRHVVDFSDLEHKTLDLLVGKNRSAPTSLAHEIGARFREVMVDEYQDSNAVQDCIFHALTQKRNNCFMVGDVKQSIYQFRLADPGIFLEKYKTYVPAVDAENGQGRKVLLSHNFRSSGSVISAVNCVFETCMSDSVGGLEYGDDESLKEGIPHIDLPEPEVELYVVDVQENTYSEEAAFVANRIRQLLDGKHMVRQGDQLRPIVPDDIVILLRSPGSVGSHFQSAVESQGIRCTTGGSDDLFQTEEIIVLRALLQVINNPQQDIPMTAVVTSRVFGLTADDIAAIRAEHRNWSVFDGLKESKNRKVLCFLEMLSELREEARLSSLSQLINKVLALTKIDSIYSALPDGDARVENIQTLCQLVTSFEANGYSDLGRFLEYLDNLEIKGFSTNEEKSTGVVRIMSIHKSKGLEFPVVFLCGLSKTFNTEDAKSAVLCDGELGFGLCCADMNNRIKYPTIAKNAIAEKMIEDSISEEMRVLYVAMTRARDRLIMTHAQRKPDNHLSDFVYRMDASPMELLTANVSCAGDWVLLSALRRQEASAFFNIAFRPETGVKVYDDPWHIDIVQSTPKAGSAVEHAVSSPKPISVDVVDCLARMLKFKYGNTPATTIPSKQTATQLKGRQKDIEIAEGTAKAWEKNFRKPSFVGVQYDGRAYGTAMHAVMQRIRFENCVDRDSVKAEIDYLVSEGILSEHYGNMADVDQIYALFQTDIGRTLLTHANVLREFKFSILVDCQQYFDDVNDEQILLQGVVDCAIIDEDGIIVLDFKTDHVTEASLPVVSQRYTDQVKAYAQALERIFQRPIKAAMLYFFRLNAFVSIL